MLNFSLVGGSARVRVRTATEYFDEPDCAGDSRIQVSANQLIWTNLGFTYFYDQHGLIGPVGGVYEHAYLPEEVFPRQSQRDLDTGVCENRPNWDVTVQRMPGPPIGFIPPPPAPLSVLAP